MSRSANRKDCTTGRGRRGRNEAAPAQRVSTPRRRFFAAHSAGRSDPDPGTGGTHCVLHDQRVTVSTLPTATFRSRSEARTEIRCSPGERSFTSNLKVSCFSSNMPSSGKISVQSPPSTEYSIVVILVSTSIAEPLTVIDSCPPFGAFLDVFRSSTRGGTLSISNGLPVRSVLRATDGGLSGVSFASTRTRYS